MSVEFVEVTLAIDFADVTLTYDGQPHGVSVTAKEGTNYTITYGTTENDCTLNNSPEYTNAGTYKIYFKVVDNDTLADYVGSVTLTINRKAVTVKVNDVTITYGETPAFSYTVTGLVDGETLSGEAVYGGAGTDAGVYEISVSGLTASDNYNVSFVPGKLTINKKEAKVDWTIAESYVYSPDGQTLPTATYDGKTASLIFTKDGTVCEFKNAGTYTVTVADNNYILTNNEKQSSSIRQDTRRLPRFLFPARTIPTKRLEITRSQKDLPGLTRTKSPFAQRRSTRRNTIWTPQTTKILERR